MDTYPPIFWLPDILWHLLGCRVFEDMSAICGHLAWGVPW